MVSVEANQWAARPWRARILRIAVAVAPVLLVTSGAWIVHRRLGPAPDVGQAAARWLVIAVVSTGVLLALDRLTRRLLPLAALLQISLVFPDHAPSRFSVALRRNETKRLERDVREGTLDQGTPQAAAERLLTLISGLSAHDRLTRGHTERVRAYTAMLTEEMRLDREEQQRAQWGALLHDVGKTHVPASILNKPGRPDAAEWAILKSHPARSWEMVRPLRAWLGEWAAAGRDHHERWDGNGYPSGRAGNDITLAGRVVAVADAFDVMTSTRSYKKPMSPGQARAELARNAGSQFDPTVVRAFMNIGLRRLRRVAGPLSWLAQLPAAGQIPLAHAPALAASGIAAAATAVVAVAAGPIVDPGTETEAASRIVAAVADEPDDDRSPLERGAGAGDPVVSTFPTETTTSAPSITTTAAPPDPDPGEPGPNAPAPSPTSPSPTAPGQGATVSTTTPVTTTTVTTTTVTTTTVTTTTSAPPSDVETISAVGGSATVSFSSEAILVLSTSPESGFDVEVSVESPGKRVEFRSDTHRSRIDLWWENGPQWEIREDEDSSGSG